MQREHDSYMNKPRTRVFKVRRTVAVAAGLAVMGGLAVYGGIAGAAPQPTVGQVQAKINQLTSQFNRVNMQLDQASQQLSTAQSRLSQVRTRLNHANAQFRAAQATVAQNAAAAFEDSGATSVAGVLTSGDPSVVLQQGSLLMELSGMRNAQTQQLLTDASELAGVEQQMQRTEDGVAALDSQLAAQKKSLGGLITTEKATLASLTVPQQQTVTTNSISTSSTTTAAYTGPTWPAGQGRRLRLRPARQHLMGATRPDSFDCSGLAQAASAAAGVAIPRERLRAVGRAAAHLLLGHPAGRPALLQRRRSRPHLRGQRLHHGRPADRDGRGEDPDGYRLVRVDLRRRRRPVERRCG